MGPKDKNSVNDQQATEMGMQFNVSYNHWIVYDFAILDNCQHYFVLK